MRFVDIIKFGEENPMKKIKSGRVRLLAATLFTLAMLWAAAAQATLISHHTFVWHDPGSAGTIEVTEEVFDNFGGDFSLYEWRYTIFNINYDPNPGMSNGLSGFNLVFPQEIPELANQYGPAGWFMNCCTPGPPHNAEWDIDNSTGFGILPGFSGVFGFTTAPRFDVITIDSWMHSWKFDSQVSIFSGSISVPGALVPEPGTMLLVGVGLLTLARSGRRRKRQSS